MCGITGYINLNNAPVRDTTRILQMLKSQKHRGPDDSGIRVFSLNMKHSLEMGIDEPERVEGHYEGILGFNRLSILDLSNMGHQPMVSPNGKVILALNGEIYNAFDYADELKDWGYQFKSTTDTEVILALYLKYGIEEMLSRLNGMFAIVVADLEKKELIISRDRFGIKPMYFIKTQNIFAFSSELKSFKYVEDFNFRLNEVLLDEYLLFRNNLHGTLYKDIQSLEPGHFLKYNYQSGVRISRYFNINDYSRSANDSGGLTANVRNLEGWLSKSVQRQLMSDVKLGCQLSGGIDSTLVTWLANRNSKKGSFEAVSIVFNDTRFSEECYIDQVSRTLMISVA